MEYHQGIIMRILFFILFAVILTEAITEIITKSDIFVPIRKFFFKRRKNNKFFNWMHELLDCGYCTSVWVGWFVIISFLCLDCLFLRIFYGGVIIHRLSNILHFVIDRLDRTNDLKIEEDKDKL